MSEEPELLPVEQLEATNPQLLTNRITEHFFFRVIGESRPISTLTIVTPWISKWESGPVSLTKLRGAIDSRRIRTVVLTRPPDEPWHADALDQLAESRLVSIYLIPNLHAKIFICDAIPMGFGLVGSANLTAQALRNFEVGILFEGRGILSHLLKELRILAQDLRRIAVSRYPRPRGG